MGGFVGDLRFAFRGLVRTPGFFAVALLTLALGVGANTAIFSVINAVYLRPLDFQEPERLVRIGQSALDGEWSMAVHTAGTWTDWRDAQTSFESFAGYRFWTTTVERGGVPSRVLSVHSLGSIFDVLGVPAMLGRTFTAEEEAAGAERLVVLSHAYWQREFGGEDPTGTVLLVEGVPHEILGVMPSTFRFPTEATAFWKTSDLTAEGLLDRDDHFVQTLGRLAEGRTLAQATDEMRRIHADLRARHPAKLANTTAELVPLREALLGGVGAMWLTLMGAVGFVLLIACLNLANLLLSRGTAREGELAVRRALGASGMRLGRMLVAESVALGAAGAVAGLAVGWLFLRGILAWMPGGVPRAEAVSIDGAVLAYTLGVACLAAAVFTALPALQLMDGSLGSRLRRVHRGSSTHAARRGLIVAEVALAVVLVTAAGLTVRGYAAVSRFDPGFDPQGRSVYFVELQGEATDEDRSVFYEELVRRVGGLPGVRAAAVTSVFPLSGFTPGAWVGTPGVVVPTGDDNPTTRYVGVSAGFREAAGIPLLRGRDFTDDEDRSGNPALLLSETAARRLFPEGDALGRTIYLGVDGAVAPLSTIVGIVGDVRQTGMSEPPGPIAYVPRSDMAFWRGFHLVVDAGSTGGPSPAEVRSVARAASSDAIVLDPRRAEDLVADAMQGQRNVMLLFALLAGVALALAVVGVFGVVAYLVGRRTREIGIRMAVGAARQDVRGLVLRQSLKPVIVGAGLGAGAATWLSRFMEGVVVGVEPTDPATFIVVPLLLVVVGGLAVWVPASRASRVDPVRVLAAE